MNASVTLHLGENDPAPTGAVLSISPGRSFILLTISGSLSLIAAGYDHAAVTSARALAAALTGAADELDTKIQQQAADCGVAS